ncbi:MAG TPA: sulfite exporter TauE/SafE family protein, partial [Anaerolineaceae bacterium]|nr:sulfite exporter TauE/SafE family protein [Anaerolineaceae bacterium]
IAKLVVYTLFGVLLGALGSVFDLTPQMRGWLQIAIAIFMLGNAMRLLNVHPIFRYFNIEPPPSLRRWIRKKAKNQENWFSPLFLGALTVFIPCGVTQTMMALAVSTGSPIQGGMIMLAFTLGASPLFFLLTYLATKLGALMEKYFVRFVALALVIFAFLSLDSGLNVMGFPYTITRLTNASRVNAYTIPRIDDPANFPSVSNNAVPQPSSDVVVYANNDGYYPYESYAIAGEPVTLRLRTNNTISCSRSFIIPSLNIRALLDATGEEVIDSPPQKAGTTLAYSCSMGMYTGVIKFQ